MNEILLQICFRSMCVEGHQRGVALRLGGGGLLDSGG